MAEVSFPFENADSNEPEWQKMARHWLATGVITGYLNQLAVTADGLSMSVSRDTGGAWVEGFYYEDVVAKAVPIEAAHATNPRIDRIVLRLDRLANSIVVAVLKGVDDGTLALTALTQTSGVYEILVADVRVDAAVGVIAANKVTDRRAFSKNLTEAAASAAYVAKAGVQWSAVAASEATTSVPYTDLATVGPSVTVDVGTSGRLLILIAATAYNSTANGANPVSVALSGANTLAAADTHAVVFGSPNATLGFASTEFLLLTGLATGSTTVTVKYRAGGGTSTYAQRRIAAFSI